MLLKFSETKNPDNNAAVNVNDAPTAEKVLKWAVPTANTPNVAPRDYRKQKSILI